MIRIVFVVVLVFVDYFVLIPFTYEKRKASSVFNLRPKSKFNI